MLIYSEYATLERICVTFNVRNKSLYQISAHWLEINSQQILQIISSGKCINSSSSPSPSHSNHGSPWKSGLMRTAWARKVSRTVIIFYFEMGPTELVRLGIFVACDYLIKEVKKISE